ncbi:MAG: hypothetical protein WCO50_04660, partial [Synechococcus sp. ELA619]
FVAVDYQNQRLPLFLLWNSRSALGIHHCFPGVGCICIPDRQALNSLAAAIRRWQIKSLKVID